MILHTFDQDEEARGPSGFALAISALSLFFSFSVTVMLLEGGKAREVTPALAVPPLERMAHDSLLGAEPPAIVAGLRAPLFQDESLNSD